MRTRQRLLSGLSSSYCFAVVVTALVLALGTVRGVSAQSTWFNCDSTATPTQMRAEGLAEKSGDFLVVCMGGQPVDPGAPAPRVNIEISLDTNVTSRILDASAGATEALLLVDEPIATQQKVCTVGSAAPCDVIGLGATSDSPYLQPNAYNVWQGRLDLPNSIVFMNVPVAPPGTPGGVRVFRITNIRANTSALGGHRRSAAGHPRDYQCQ